MTFVTAGLLLFFVLVFVGSLLIAASAYMKHVRQKAIARVETTQSNERPYPRIFEYV